MATEQFAIGIDIGGTFTDVVLRGSHGTTHLAKIPSTRSDPSAAVRSALDALGPRWGISAAQVDRFVHGTTVATNAVLERKGAKVGLLATDGFTDVLEIGRQSRAQLYDLVVRPQTPSFLSPGALRRGVLERIGPNGAVEVPLDVDSLDRALDALVAQGVEAVAICFLFSFINSEHERRAAAYVRERHPSIAVSLSSEVDPAFREYERTAVTAFDAYLKPVLDRYLASMEAALREAGVRAPLQLMQSRGGTSSSTIARRFPVRLFLSGPAAGVIGANEVGASVGERDLITVDIGGTSSDIALINGGAPAIRAEGWVDTYTIRVPMIDVNAVGAGGGSIAWIDAAGGLRVGPQSAGAEPGPACYGRGGTDATVTDASVVLGMLNPGYFAGGSLALDPARARATIEERVARPLGLTVEQAALGIHRVVNVQMAEGIRLVSIKRGIDPRGYALVPFGGAGPVHATALADELEISTILVPATPGVLSASGLLAARIEHEVGTTYIRAIDGLDVAALKAAYGRLEAECAVLMRDEGVEPNDLETLRLADICYVGQAHYVEVPVSLAGEDPTSRLYDAFCHLYEQHYGHHTRAPARLVNLRVLQRGGRCPAAAAAGPTVIPGVPEEVATTRATTPMGTRRLLTARTGGFVDAAVHNRAQLGPGAVLDGPAIVDQPDTTVVIEPGWRAIVGRAGVLALRRTS